MNWGKWIIVSFILFAAFIAVLVAICVRQDVSLVSKDYYRDELTYQDQIGRMHNTMELVVKPVITVVEQKFIKIQFDEFDRIRKGEVKLFCPANELYDKQFEIRATHEKEQLFSLAGSPAGMYRVKFMWTMNGEEFYMEEIINI